MYYLNFLIYSSTVSPLQIMDDVVTVGTFVVLSTARYYDENFPLLAWIGASHVPIATICAHPGKLDRNTRRLPPAWKIRNSTFIYLKRKILKPNSLFIKFERYYLEFKRLKIGISLPSLVLGVQAVVEKERGCRLARAGEGQKRVWLCKRAQASSWDECHRRRKRRRRTGGGAPVIGWDVGGSLGCRPINTPDFLVLGVSRTGDLWWYKRH